MEQIEQEESIQRVNKILLTVRMIQVLRAVSRTKEWYKYVDDIR